MKRLIPTWRKKSWVFMAVLLALLAAVLMPTAASATASFTVTPSRLDFGVVPVGQVTLSQSLLTVTNTGDEDLNLSGQLIAREGVCAPLPGPALTGS